MTAMDDTMRGYLAAANAGDQDEADRLAAQIDADARATDDRLNQPGALLAAALWYASEGIHVFPVQPGAKRPATLHGFKDATTSARRITEWWGRWPDANIGLPTGHRFDVIDVDGPEGYRSLTVLRDAGMVPATIGRATTPHGSHLYIPATGDGNTTALLPGIDYRGNGGYVLAPPSRLIDGVYRWTQPINLTGGAA